MEEALTMLTPSELQKMPKCKYSYFAKCLVKEGKRGSCLECLLTAINQAMIMKDLVDANNLLHALVELLREQKLLEAKP